MAALNTPKDKYISLILPIIKQANIKTAQQLLMNIFKQLKLIDFENKSEWEKLKSFAMVKK